MADDKKDSDDCRLTDEIEVCWPLGGSECCANCGGSAGLVYIGKDDGHTDQRDWDYWECPRCSQRYYRKPASHSGESLSGVEICYYEPSRMVQDRVRWAYEAEVVQGVSGAYLQVVFPCCGNRVDVALADAAGEDGCDSCGAKVRCSRQIQSMAAELLRAEDIRRKARILEIKLAEQEGRRRQSLVDTKMLRDVVQQQGQSEFQKQKQKRTGGAVKRRRPLRMDYYPGLRLVSFFFRLAALINGLALIGTVVFFGFVLSGRLGGLTGEAVGLTVVLVLVESVAMAFCLAVPEVVQVFLQIAENTRETSEILAGHFDSQE